MEEQEIIYDTIRVYDAVKNIYYDKQIPHVEPEKIDEPITQDDMVDMLLDLQEQIILLELGE